MGSVAAPSITPGVVATDDELAAAIDEAWRENGRRRDDLHRDLVARDGPGGRDISRDGVGSHTHEFSAELNRRFLDRNGKVMRRLGYLS